VLTVKKGVSNTLVTLNKALSVSGLVLLSLAFLPQFALTQSELIRNSLGMLAVHATYSIVHFYGTPIVPRIETWTSAQGATAAKIGALMLGGFAQNLLGAGYMQFISRLAIVYGTLTLGTAHFLAERHSSGMPPAGYAAIGLTAWAIVSVYTGAAVIV
jgi:hypothetical protein